MTIHEGPPYLQFFLRKFCHTNNETSIQASQYESPYTPEAEKITLFPAIIFQLFLSYPPLRRVL